MNVNEILGKRVALLVTGVCSGRTNVEIRYGAFRQDDAAPQDQRENCGGLMSTAQDPIGFESCDRSASGTYGFNPAVQFMITVNGVCVLSSIGTPTKKRFPSGVTSHTELGAIENSFFGDPTRSVSVAETFSVIRSPLGAL